MIDMMDFIEKRKNKLYRMDRGKPWKHGEFERVAYSKWALEELLRFLKNHKYMDGLQAIEVFRKQIDDCGCTAKTNQGKMIFLYAYDAVTYMLDELIMVGYGGY